MYDFYHEERTVFLGWFLNYVFSFSNIKKKIALIQLYTFFFLIWQKKEVYPFQINWNFLAQPMDIFKYIHIWQIRLFPLVLNSALIKD